MRWNDFDFFGFDLLHFIDRMLDSIHSKVPPAANFICRPARCYRGHDGPSDRNATISARDAVDRSSHLARSATDIGPLGLP